MRVVRAGKQESVMGDGVEIASASVRFRNFAEEAHFLRKRANEFGRNLPLRELALKIIFPNCESRDESCQALAIGTWVQENIKYVHEATELFQSPMTTLRLKAGDCDDHATLINSLLTTVGIKNKFCILNIRGQWAHIYAVALVKVPGEGLHRMTLDSTLDERINELVNPIAKLKERGVTAKAIFV